MSRRLIAPASENQLNYVEAIRNKTLIFCLGRAGTGKSLLAINEALNMIKEQKTKINKLIYVRPIIRERHIEDEIGFLPGSRDEKIADMYGGLRHNLDFILGPKEATTLFEKGIVESTVLSHMRGSSYSNCFIVLDEATLLHFNSGAMKLFLTRIGKNSKVVVLGDKRQSPLSETDMDMIQAMDLLQDLKDVACVTLDDFVDVQRSELVREILKAYETEA